MITIVDYGLGNIAAFLNVFKRSNLEAAVARDAQAIERASRLILPGVGSFDNAMQRLAASGMGETLTRRVVEDRVPVLGVCVGMQMMARSSDEGDEPGLGWIDANVMNLRTLEGASGLPLPHMGWNDVGPTAANGLFSGLENDARFYFLHSYYIACERRDDVAATASYGSDFACAIHRDNIYGVQFHPEKSHHFGACLLANFART